MFDILTVNRNIHFFQTCYNTDGVTSAQVLYYPCLCSIKITNSVDISCCINYYLKMYQIRNLAISENTPIKTSEVILCSYYMHHSDPS